MSLLEKNKKLFRGIIFDLNGTIFWDTPFHNQAWDRFLDIHQIFLTDREKDRIIHGKNNQEIFPELFNRKIEHEELSHFIKEKELIYQQICMGNKMQLAPGAIDFLTFLQSGDIPFTIATASGKENIDFYYKYLKLGEWFDYDNIVYNDGSFPGKPNPDIFLRASEKLGIKPGELMVFEDSYNGIMAAERAGFGKIYIVNSTDDNYLDWPYEIIYNFSQVDLNLIKAKHP